MWNLLLPLALSAGSRLGGGDDDDRDRRRPTTGGPPTGPDPIHTAILTLAQNMLPSHLRGPMAGTMTPSTPVAPDDLLEGYSRRGGSSGGGARGILDSAAHGATLGTLLPGFGTVTGALGGAAFGGLRNLFTRRAATAPTDLRATDAADALTRAYEQFLGRTPSQDEVWGRIRGTGWQPGHDWVGESGLNFHLRDIAESEEARRRRQTNGRLF